MEPTRELASVDLAAVCSELSPLEGAFFQKAYVYPEHELYRLKLRHPDRGRLELLGQAGDVKRLNLADPEHVPEAPTRPPNVAKMLRNRLSGGRLVGVEQYEFDRIATVTFEVEDGTVDVVFELFGDGNVVVIGVDETIVDCLREVRLQSRTVRPGGRYEPPASQVAPFELSRDEFRATMLQSDTDVVRTLATAVNLGGRYAREVCARSGVDQDRTIDDLDGETFDALYAVLERFGERLEAGDFDPHVYRDGAGVVDVSPFHLESHPDLEADTFDTVNAAMAQYFSRLPERREESDEGGDDERARLQRIIAQQTDAIEEYEREAEALRERAERLYARYEAVDELLEHVRRARSEGMAWEAIEERLEEGAQRGLDAAFLVEGVDPAANRVTIDLDGEPIDLEVDQSLEHNAERLYREAKELEAKREGAKEALEETRDSLEALEAEPAGPSPEATPDATNWLDRSSVPIRREDHWYERFRWFHTSDDFLVIGGRSAKQNEELVNKYTEPTDRVLHAQAHGGPVTVVKASAPDESARDVTFPERTFEEAAQFAVSYSSVWKDGHFTGDAYLVRPEQLTKGAESGEYLETGAFAVRGERRYFRDVAVGVTIGVSCEPETRVLGGPPSAVRDRVVTHVDLEPGRFAQSDVAKRLYRHFREEFEDERFVRRVASADRIQPFLPPGGSRILDD